MVLQNIMYNSPILSQAPELAIRITEGYLVAHDHRQWSLTFSGRQTITWADMSLNLPS